MAAILSMEDELIKPHKLISNWQLCSQRRCICLSRSTWFCQLLRYRFPDLDRQGSTSIIHGRRRPAHIVQTIALLLVTCKEPRWRQKLNWHIMHVNIWLFAWVGLIDTFLLIFAHVISIAIEINASIICDNHLEISRSSVPMAIKISEAEWRIYASVSYHWFS